MRQHDARDAPILGQDCKREGDESDVCHQLETPGCREYSDQQQTECQVPVLRIEKVPDSPERVKHGVEAENGKRCARDGALR